MLFARTRSSDRPPQARIDRARELVLYLEQGADLADLVSTIVGELEADSLDQAVSRDHALSALSGLITMMEGAIAEICEMEGLTDSRYPRTVAAGRAEPGAAA